MLTEFSQVESAGQVLTFVYSVLLGVAACLLYDIFRAVRTTFRFGWVAVLICDVLYFAIVAVVTVCFFMVRCSGVLRLYVLLGMALGGILCRLTVSRFVLAALLWIGKWTKKTVGWLLMPLRWLLGKARIGVGKVSDIFVRFFKKSFKTKKKPLANHPRDDV